jgi:hypothetical protein
MSPHPLPGEPAAEGSQPQTGAAQPGPVVGASELAQLDSLAKALEGDPVALLDLLRRLETLHRAIQDGPFRNSLPSDRHQLYRLLERMEDKGGWPYIPRLQLRTFMDLLQQGGGPEASGEGEPPLAA